MPSRLKLSVTIEHKHPSLPRFVVISGEALANWNLSGTAVVEGKLNDVALGRRTIKAWGKGRDVWFIEIPEALCRKAGVDTNSWVSIHIWLASTILPAELSDILAKNPKARAIWDALTTSQKRGVRENVAVAKNSATRSPRAMKWLLPAG